MIGELGYLLGVRNIRDKPGCWEHQLDGSWWFAVNPHDERVKCSMGYNVAPRSVFVEFNGWPAGAFDAHGGCIAAGTEANEDTFIEAVKRAMPVEA